MTRRRALSPDAVAEALRRYELFRRHNPKKIAADLGVPVRTLRDYIRGIHKVRADECSG